MMDWLRNLGPLGLLLAVTCAVLLLAAVIAAFGIIAWVLSGECDTDDAAVGSASTERRDDDEPDPGGGEVTHLPLQAPSEPPPSRPKRAA